LSMEQKTLEEAVHLARKTGIVFLGSADHRGIPHVCAATDLAVVSRKNRFRLSFWCCPTTSFNTGLNPHVSVVIWDKILDKGYQILGEIREVSGNGETSPAVSGRQVERSLLIEIEKILLFKKTPHTDREAGVL